MIKNVYTEQLDKMKSKLKKTKEDIIRLRKEQANEIEILKDELNKANQKLALVGTTPVDNSGTPAPAASALQSAAASGGPPPSAVPRPMQDRVDSIEKNYPDSDEDEHEFGTCTSKKDKDANSVASLSQAGTNDGRIEAYKSPAAINIPT